MKKVVMCTIAGLLLCTLLIPSLAAGYLVEREIIKLPFNSPDEQNTLIPYLPFKYNYKDERIGDGTVKAWFNFTYSTTLAKLDMKFWKPRGPPSFDLVCSNLTIFVKDEYNNTYYKTVIANPDRPYMLFCNNWVGRVMLPLGSPEPQVYPKFYTIVIDINGCYE
jgi:hypothetical protein